MSHDQRPGTALRRLLPPGARLWLVRPETGEATAAISFVLLYRLSGFLVGLGGEVVRHG